MKKVYTIRITGCSKPGIWYDGKKDREFDAELKFSGSMAFNMQVIAFYVNPCQFVHLIDCEVIGERLVEIYQNKNA